MDDWETLGSKLRTYTGANGTQYLGYWCQGCGHEHSVPVNGTTKPMWGWDGNVEQPTLTPSVRHFHHESVVDAEGNVQYDEKGYRKIGPEVTDCHYHIKQGRIEYCGDCAHAMSGQVSELLQHPWPCG